MEQFHSKETTPILPTVTGKDLIDLIVSREFLYQWNQLEKGIDTEEENPLSAAAIVDYLKKIGIEDQDDSLTVEKKLSIAVNRLKSANGIDYYLSTLANERILKELDNFIDFILDLNPNSSIDDVEANVEGFALQNIIKDAQELFAALLRFLEATNYPKKNPKEINGADLFAQIELEGDNSGKMIEGKRILSGNAYLIMPSPFAYNYLKMIGISKADDQKTIERKIKDALNLLNGPEGRANCLKILKEDEIFIMVEDVIKEVTGKDGTKDSLDKHHPQMKALFKSVLDYLSSKNSP